MPRFADPTRCPDCAAVLPVAPRACPRCGLPLTGELVDSLFSTLQRADDLLGRVRESARPRPAAQATGPAPVIRPPAPAASAPFPGQPVPAQQMPRQPMPAQQMPGQPLPGQQFPGQPVPPAPAPAAAPAQGGLGLGAVPKILLGLGALCLIVGAITFLAMTWDTLGVGGRTLTLVAFTLAAAAGAAELGRRNLRIGAESLTVVALGLLALDVVGAAAAGWLGDLDGAATTAVTGGVVTLAAAAVLALTTQGDRRALVAPQVVSVLALNAAGLGLVFAVDGGHALALGATVVAMVLLGLLGRVRSLPALAWLGAAGAAMWWLVLLARALARVIESDQLDLATLYGDGTALPLVLTALLLPVVGLPVRPGPEALGASVGAGAVILTGVALLPAVDERDWIRTVAICAAVIVWAGVAALARGRFASWAARTGAVAVWPAVAVMTQVALVRALVSVWHGQDAWSLNPLASTEPPSQFDSPLLTLLVGVALFALPFVAATRWLGWSQRETLERFAAPAAVLVVATTAQFTVAIGVVVLVGLLLQVALSLATLQRTDLLLRLLGVPLGLAVLLAALPSDALTTLVMATWTALVAARAFLGPKESAHLELALLPAPATLTLWSLAHVVDAPYGVVPLVVLLVLAALPLLKPVLEREVPVLIAFGLSSLTSLGLVDRPLSWLAAHLVALAVICAASALLHPQRRSLAWVGGVLVALAAWLRMADVGVTTVEAYTLPAALVLLVLGAELMRRNERISSVTGLLVGLLLGVAPSLFIVLTEGGAMGWRGGLLATACLAMVVGGVVLRLSTPLVVGAVAGVVLALQVLGPVARDVPTFVWLGLAGILLTVMGITWEARVANLRATGQYLARLR